MSSKKLTVLVAEDEPDTMHILSRTLAMGGFEVIEAYGGEIALRKAKIHRPDLVITDLAMPEVSGVELIEMLRADPDLSRVPIIAITAYLWDEITQSAGRIGCDSFLSKPFEGSALLRLAFRLLNQSKNATAAYVPTFGRKGAA